MFGFETSDVVGVVSAGISLVALAINLLITRRQTRISFETLKFNNDSQVMNWANRVVVAMSEALHVSGATNVSAAFLHERGLSLSTNLSALIDEGRWFFPNTGSRSTDGEKPGAYRGSRQAILDHVFVVYQCASELQQFGDGSREALAGRIAEAKRHFVTEVQHAVDPRRRAWVMDRFRKY
ncbi:MAG: hypothetical protein K8S25_01280 [Alphaproteobacteria bacterium]|nr:hypothetical protein [Alphaproteobacteria bacterium]